MYQFTEIFQGKYSAFVLNLGVLRFNTKSYFMKHSSGSIVWKALNDGDNVENTCKVVPQNG